MINRYSYVPAYSQAKLANILFTKKLAKQFKGEGIIANAMHPGIVGSNFANHGDEKMRGFLATKSDETISPKQAAEDLIWLATSEAAGDFNGEYFYQCKVVPTSAYAQDDQAAERLWLESEKLVGSWFSG